VLKQSVNFTLTRNNIPDPTMTCMSSLQIIVYDCNPTNFGISVSLVELTRLGPTQTITWSQNALNPLCGTYTVSGDATLQPLLSISGQNIVIQTSTAGDFTGTLTLKRANDPSMTATTTLQIKIYDCSPINFQLSDSTVSLEMLSASHAVTWSYTQRHALCGSYTVTSSNSALVRVD
jgi:hypothetical protein